MKVDDFVFGETLSVLFYGMRDDWNSELAKFIDPRR
jgi:hypothetical protein